MKQIFDTKYRRNQNNPGKKTWIEVPPWGVILIMIIIGSFLMSRGFRGIIIGYQSIAWPTTIGKIIKSEVTYHPSVEKPFYTADIEFEYIVNNVKYVSKTFSTGTDVRTEPEAKDLSRSYPEGKKVTVHYSMQKPILGILEPGMKKDVFVLFLIGFSLTAIAIYSALKRFKNRSQTN